MIVPSWKETKNVKYYELKCKCCGRNEMLQSFIDRLQVARDYLEEMFPGVVFRFISGFRCYTENLRVGGKPHSAHKHGRGCDIEYRNSFECFAIYEALRFAGFTRIGINNGGIHVDDMNDEKHPSPCLFNYY